MLTSAYFAMLLPQLLLLMIIGIPIAELFKTSDSSTQLYVAPFQSYLAVDGDGSLAHPYSSLQQALDHIERHYHQGISTPHRTTIYLYPTYHFVGGIRLEQAHSHIRLTTMNAEETAIYEQLLHRDGRLRRL